MNSDGNVKSEGDLNSDSGDSEEQEREGAVSGGGGRGNGWFDIVMESNEQRGLEDERIKG